MVEITREQFEKVYEIAQFQSLLRMDYDQAHDCRLYVANPGNHIATMYYVWRGMYKMLYCGSSAFEARRIFNQVKAER